MGQAFFVRRAAAAFALLALLVTTAVAPVHTAGDADAVHGVVAAHDAEAHVFTGAPAPAHAPLHCLACHAARSFRPALDITIAAAPVAVPRPPRCDGDGALCSATGNAQPPLRAPPLSSPAFA